ncbi:hypothetical protein FRC01_002602 [Tulasnella sp. 417]|nr:hypothetical protein FRC01_002602 [Tulasnella sp. 417]
MSAPFSDTNNARSNLYPMGVFNDELSTSTSSGSTLRPSMSNLQQLFSPLDDLDPGSMQVDPVDDSDSDSDAGSWRSAESSHDESDEQAQSPESQSQVEDGDPFVEPALKVGMSQLSVAPLTQAQQSEQGEVEKKPEDEDETMSIAETEIDETNDASFTSSSSAVTDASGATTGSAESGNSLIPPTILNPVPRYRFVPVWDSNSSSRSRTPPSLKELAPTHCSVIAHSEKHVRWFDNYGVPWSAQWQIAVLVSKGALAWKDITEQMVQALSGTNSAVGPKVSSVLFPGSRRRSSGLLVQGRNPYAELDREEAALDKGTSETLGLRAPSDGDTGLDMGTWWGGRVEQRAFMKNLGVDSTRPKSMCRGVSPSPKVRWGIQLHPQEMRGKSCRFTRKLGSRRFIQLKIPELRTQAERDSLQEELLKPHLLHGRIFRAFSTHDGTIRLVETDEDVGRVARPEVGDSRRLSFLQFLDWFNPLKQNAHQIISKWSARFTLGLSTSQPVLLFNRANMHFIPDIVSLSHDPRAGSPASKHIMTDGCGRMNRAALRQIQKNKGLQSMPTALQGRIAGAKGLWILDDDDQADVPRIWITSSQVKIRYTPEQLDEDPSRRIFDLLRIGQVKTPARLSAQPITNFAHNGVPNATFSELLQESLKETIDHLFEEWKSDDAISMWDLVFNKGGVGHIRKGRYAKIFERIFGNFRDTEEADESSWTSEVFGSPVDLDASDTGPDPNSGWPTELAEQITELFQAGFTPSKCAYLASLMKIYLKMEVKRMIQGCHIPVKRSAEAFAAPDFSGILKPGEVFFRSSQQCGLVDDPVMADGIVRGEMIIFRYPIRTPSDGRLVRAVDYPELRNFTDVLLFSTLGDRSGASILAGGDYDGDTIHMVTEPRLVSTFKNSSLKYADPPGDFDTYIEAVASRGQEVVDALPSLTEAELVREFQMILLEPVSREKHYGRYSTLTDIATYIYGYDSDETHYLSYMFSNELDAEKSGIHVIKRVWENDLAHFRQWNQPACMRKPGDEGRKKEPRRPQHLGPFVLDILNPFAQEQEKRYLELIEKLDIDADTDCDPVLVAPVDEAESRARRLISRGQNEMWQELERMKSFVEGNRRTWARLFTEQRGTRPSQASHPLARNTSSLAPQDSAMLDQSDFYQLPKKTQIQKKREVADEFWNGFEGIDRLVYFSEDEARRVMGSYAYQHAYERAQRAAVARGGRKGSFEYAFVVAFRTLAELKGKSNGKYSISVDPFHDFMIPRRNVRDEGRMEVDSSVL